MEYWKQALLDTFSPSATIERANQDRNANRVRGLMDQYRGAPITMGIPHQDQVQQGPGGLLNQNAQLPPQFYQEAGTVPGYEQLLGNAQTGGQAMDRQVQNQGWQQNNMTAAQAEMARLQAQQQAQQQAQWQQEFGGLSAYQQAQLNADREAAAQPNVPAGSIWDSQSGRVRPLPGTPADLEQVAQLDQIQTAIDVLSEQKTMVDEQGTADWTARGRKMDMRTRATIIPALAQMFGSGKLDQGERENYESMVQLFDEWNSGFTTANKAKANADALIELMNRRMEEIQTAQGRPGRGAIP